MTQEPLRSRSSSYNAETQALEQQPGSRTGNGFILADGTGAGKTSQELAVAEMHRRDGKVVLIVTKSEVISRTGRGRPSGGSFKSDGKRLGIKVQLLLGDEKMQPGTIYLTSYDRIKKLAPVEGQVVIFDESHALKNVESGRAAAGQEHIDAADAVMFASATPMDKVQHMPYLSRAGILEGKTPEEQMKALGLAPFKKRVKGGAEKVVWAVDPRIAEEISKR
jgi:hypothetical protein